MSKKIKLSDHFSKNDQSINYNYYTLKPECEILVNKQKRKTYGKNKNKIYLNNGDNIQIYIFNPTYQRIGVQLDFNGQLEEKMLIVNPGQKTILERFLDSKKKIIFSTYFIDSDDDRSKKAIEKNGIVKIHFWNEKINYSTFITSTVGTQDYLGIQGYAGNRGVSGIMGCSSSYSVNNSNVPNINISNTNPLETGRLEKGDKSNQKMKKVEFEPNYIFQVDEFKLIPFSQIKKKKTESDNIKPKTVSIDSHNNYHRNTEHRIYCSESVCGYRIRNSNWKFCPICGTEIE